MCRSTLNDFGISISLLRVAQESEDMSEEAEEVSGRPNMMKRGVMDRKNNSPMHRPAGSAKSLLRRANVEAGHALH